MLEHKKIRKLDDYFIELDGRQEKGVYFYRINGYTDEIGEFIKKYYDVARRTGVVIEGKLANPDEKNLAYYDEIMGMDFQMNPGFIAASLKKWLPRMNEDQRARIAGSVYDSLDSLQRAGKTENMLKNAYIKFMCWLYYRFERMVSRLGENNIPKILYEGDIGSYELMLISILSKAGCDVVLLQHHGDQSYLKADPQSRLSENLQMAGMRPFPDGYSLKAVREEIQRDFDQERLYGTRPAVRNCTNAWAKGRGLEDIRESVGARGSDPGFFYNCYYRIHGADDRNTYANELLRFQQELGNSKRRLVIVDGEIARPSPEEIAGIHRGNYLKQDQMILDLSGNIRYGADTELQRLMHTAFVDVLLSEAAKGGGNLNKLTNQAVYLLCWLKRYQSQLFSGWKLPEISCFIYLGGCKNGNEALFLRFLARLPVDVLILCPDLNQRCCLEDSLLCEVHYTESLNLTRYPSERSQFRIGTAAYHAERDLDTLLYQDTGMYRNRQYGKANIISLQTMYEEIRILWNQDLKYRPGFHASEDTVNIPVIFAKVSGVKGGAVNPYWNSVKELITEDIIFVKSVPYLEPTSPNPMRSCSAEFYRNGKLQKGRIKNHPQYPYGILREDMQDLILDKLELLIAQKLIKGIGENGIEYTVIATVLNLPKDVVRLIQKFDFTKKNPKLVYIHTTENMVSLEDSVIAAFLNLIGFDMVFFVPTGYQCVEKYFTRPLMDEHQIGEYMYDLWVPDWKWLSSKASKATWRERIFGERH